MKAGRPSPFATVRPGYGHDQRVAHLPGRLEVFDVTHVQQVEQPWQWTIFLPPSFMASSCSAIVSSGRILLADTSVSSAREF